MTRRKTGGRFVSSKTFQRIRRYGYANFLNHLREEGVTTTIAKAVFVPLRWGGWARSWLAGRVFDHRHGLRTSGHVPLDYLAMEGLDVADSHSYLPTPVNVLPDVLPRLGIDYGAFTFVDLGSGKGAAILAAAEFDFRRIVGVEFSRDLHATSEENVRRYRQRHAVQSEVEILNMDVRDFVFPEDELVVYAFNPFEADLLREVVMKLAASYDATPRRIILVYLNVTRKINPRAIIAGCGFMKEVRVFDLWEMTRFYSKCPFQVAVWTSTEDGAITPRSLSRGGGARLAEPVDDGSVIARR
jgi:SAM-dependent methyltransferase